MATICVTHTAPTNIAVIKYWGKASAKLNTPINSSVSVTMNQDDLKAITTIVASPAFEQDRLWLNGVEENIISNARVQTVLREIRSRARDRAASDGSVIPSATLRSWRVHITSRNTFPTAAGLASSAAGYACLVHSLADVYGVVESSAGELSSIARQGSGSACRSMYGGFVEWRAGGAASDASDSIAVQVADEAHWPELRVLIAVVSDKKKSVGSSEGMKVSVETSTLIATRATSIVPPRLEAMKAAYRAKDFDTFATLTMKDSNQFHAICLDSFPPIKYMNDTSARIIAAVHELNAAVGRTVAGYTFDAGPNAVLFTRAGADENLTLAMLLTQFPPAEGASSGFVSSPEAEAAARTAVPLLPASLRETGPDVRPGVVKHVYVTTAGDGPRVLTGVPGAALADAVTGLPFVTAAAADATLAPAL